MPIKVTYQNPGLEYDENMVCEDFLNMGMLPLDLYFSYGLNLERLISTLNMFRGYTGHRHKMNQQNAGAPLYPSLKGAKIMVVSMRFLHVLSHELKVV
jgi:hypothetical protein